MRQCAQVNWLQDFVRAFVGNWLVLFSFLARTVTNIPIMQRFPVILSNRLSVSSHPCRSDVDNMLVPLLGCTGSGDKGLFLLLTEEVVVQLLLSLLQINHKTGCLSMSSSCWAMWEVPHSSDAFLTTFSFFNRISLNCFLPFLERSLSKN